MREEVDLSAMERVVERISRLEDKMRFLKNNRAQPVTQVSTEGDRHRGEGIQNREEEKERRKNCLVVHGVIESRMENAQDRIKEDMSQINFLFSQIICEEVRVSKIFRLGKKAVDTEEMTEERRKPRPIKLVLNTEEDKMKILKKAKNLRLRE